MHLFTSKASKFLTGLAASVLLLTGQPASAQTAATVSLTAAPTTTLLPDGQTVPMWGYSCTAAASATCAAANAAAAGTWSPVVITVPYSALGTSLSITLTNGLSFTTPTAAVNNVPTSLVIVGQLGGGLDLKTTDSSVPHHVATDSPAHGPQGVTWSIINSGANAIIVTNGGTGYSAGTTATLVGGGGTGALATPTISSTGVITAVTLTAPGTGYVSPPQVVFSDPANTGTGAAATVNMTVFQAGGENTPPAQLKRVQSFGTEVGAGTSATLTWNNLRPGTYLIESGTHPSIQAPMGLYGILVVTQAPAGTVAGQAYPNSTLATAVAATYDADLPLILSEIDPAQNNAVATAVASDGFKEMAVWSGTPGACGDAAVHNCYPPAVNYSPRFYQINGVSFDRTNIAASTLTTNPAIASGAAANTGNVLVRFVNAGLRMHVPAFVNQSLAIVAEDGNPLPGQARIQNEVFLPAGKTHDALLHLATAGTGTYAGMTLPVFDRQLSLSTNNQRDGGMQAYVAVAGGAATGAGTSASQVSLSIVAAKTYYCSAGNTLSVSDPTAGLLGGSTGANGVTLVTSALPGTLTLQSNGTFTYAAPATGSCGGTFSYQVNSGANAKPGTATITECDAASHADSKCNYSTGPKYLDDAFTASNAKRLRVAPPGVLANDSDPTGLVVHVDPKTVVAGPGLTLAVNPDGSFAASVAAAGTYSFTYNILNSQGTAGTCASTACASTTAATVTLTFPQGSGLQVNIYDRNHIGDPNWKITDYRWVIEEDRTFWIDPKCQNNRAGVAPTSPNWPKDAYGRPCAPNPVEALGYNFHTATMPTVATGCLGAMSCEQGQTVQGSPAVCDKGDGVCRTTDAAGNPLTSTAMRDDLDPSYVALDPNKHYFISIMPGDGINPTLQGSGGPVTYTDKLGNPNAQRPFDPLQDCPNYGDYAPGTGACGHNMGGKQIPPQFDPHGTPIQPSVTIGLVPTPLPTAKIAVLVYEDDYPLNGENDAGGGVDIIAPNEAGLGGFQIVLFDQAGQLGDNTGQPTYDMFNMPLTNSLAGTMDPNTGLVACPITSNKDNIIGMIVTCPTYESDNKTLSPLAGQAVIPNLYPGLYEIQAFPSADRIARGEEWLQTNTLDGGKPHEAFIRPGEPSYFQEFGPGGFHVQIGYANPKIINDRRHNAAGTGLCDPAVIQNGVNVGGGGLVCNSKVIGHVHGNHMSRTPDERTYDSGSYDAFAFSSCYVSLGLPDAQDIAFAKCDSSGNFEMDGLPDGTFKVAVFDQWNDIMLDGLITSLTVNGITDMTVTATQWRTNLYTRTYLDLDGNGVPTRDAAGNDLEPGAALVPIKIRYRDGSIGFQNTTDLNGYATYNEVFPLMNWLVVEPDSTRFKPTSQHVVYDAGGPDDCSPAANAAGLPCSKTAAFLAGTTENNSLPTALRVPGAVYCPDADCALAGDSFANGPYIGGGSSGPTSKLSSGRIDPPWTTEGWQGLLGQHSFIDFGFRPFKAGENGGIWGLVVYASTRPYDDPALLTQLVWEPGVANVTVNLYKEDTAADGTTTLTLVDTTQTSSWDKWAQGFRTDGSGTGALLQTGTGANAGYIPNMNCPGQDPSSGFFATLQGSKMWLDSADSSGNKKSLAYNSQFKCFDGWSMLNQIQPAPYDGRYTFPSIVDRDPTTGHPSGTGHLNGAATPLAGTNCTVCKANTADPTDPVPQLPPGKYVVEIVPPAGYEIVKEEDKNILMGDIYVAPLNTQFTGLGNVFILPDQAALNAYYNPTNPVNSTTNLGVVNLRSDFASPEQMWPCVGAMRTVPDVMSLFPAVGQTAPFAGAVRPLCDRKEVVVADQQTTEAKFFVFTKAHIAGHFVGGMTNDMASEFDPFSPQFGEKFGVPNLPIRMRDFMGDEVSRVYGDQWGAYNGMYFSSWEVNPPNPTGYAPQMSIACMNDPGPVLDNDPTSPTFNTMITDPNYNPAYSNFCYETPFMPGFTAYMDTPVVPTQAFADHYNLPDAEYPDGTPVIRRADFKGVTATGGIGPWAPGSGAISGITVNVGGQGYTTAPSVTLTGGTGDTATACIGVGTVKVTNGGSGYTSGFRGSNAGVTFTGGGGTQTALANAIVTGGQVTAINVTRAGCYASTPTVTISRTSGRTGSGATASVSNMSVARVAVIGSGAYTAPTVAFSGGGGSGAIATATLSGVATSQILTLTAFGDRSVQNPAYTGPSGVGTPYNAKTITRHYGFGAQCTSATASGCVAVSSVTIGGKAATVQGWSDTAITVAVPTGVPACPVQQFEASNAVCGEVVVLNGQNGKQSIDGITVTVGGKTPTVVTTGSPTSTAFGEFFANPLQTAIDNAAPGDLLIIDAGNYRENLIMWKPVRLQGVGAGSVTINADAHPAGKMDSWRRRVSCLFGLTIDGVPNPSNGNYDSSGNFACPGSMFFRADRIPFEGFIGWDASSNGNLAQVLQEPSLMGAYEGAGITAVGRGVNQSGTGNSDLWGQAAGAGQFADGSRYANATTDCFTALTATSNVDDYATSNFLCNPSGIDGLSIINSSQGGGGVFLHGWNHNIQIANNRISNNAGTLSGAINLGNGETPPPFVVDNTICFSNPAAAPNPAPLCPPIPAWASYINPVTGRTVQGVAVNAQIPMQLNTSVRIHHNQIIDNASIGDALFSGSPAGAGGVSVSSGSDLYLIDHNWIAANLTSSDGGGIAHMGASWNGKIQNNFVLFNQANNPTLPVDGGGIAIMGAQQDRTLPNGQECGGTTDTDCPPGIGDGTGMGLVIDGNLMLGNSAEDGSGGGIRLRQVNGSEIAAFLGDPTEWFDVTVTNNIIVNNVAGWDGGGVSLQDAFKTTFVNNTVASNDTTSSAGVLFKSLGAINSASPPPGCIPTPDPTQPQNPNCLGNSVIPAAQPSGLVTMQNTPNMMAQFSGTVVCPAGFGYGNATDTASSRQNGRCLLVSLPKMVNDLFYQNRAFHIEIVGPGGGLISNQNIVALMPQFAANPSYTGQCLAPPSGQELYWDVGVRLDTQISGHNLVFNAATVGAGYTLGADATAALVGPITALTLTSGGAGYTGVTSPTATFVAGTGGGSGAVATVAVAGPVGSVTVTASGTGYTTAPTVTITRAAGDTTGGGATAVATLTGNQVTGITLVTAGTNYTAAPVVTLTGGGGTGATATALLDAVVTSVTLTAGGNYSVIPVVEINGGGGSGARVTATVTGKVQNPLTLIDGGSGYTSAPTVTITPSDATIPTVTATATAKITNGIVTALTLTNPGAGYTAPPTVTFTGGGVAVNNASGVGGPITLAADHSIFTDQRNLLNVVTNASNFYPTSTTPVVVGQYCNGPRMPPEQCTVATSGANPLAMCQGYFVPPGQSETAGISSVFLLHGIQASATVDEGNNWINMTYGPLSLSRPVAGNGAYVSEPIVANAVVAARTGSYVISGDSQAVGAGTANGAPAVDFFGRTRPAAGVSIGAVEYIPPVPTLTSVLPQPGNRGENVAVTLTGTDFTTASVVTVTGGVTVSGVTRVSSTTLTATFTIPGNAPASVNVSVATSGGTSNAVAYQVQNAPAPTLTSISPAIFGVPLTGSSAIAVTLTGTNLTTDSVVAVSAAGVTVTNVAANAASTQLTATVHVPSTAPLGSATVTVTTNGGVSNGIAVSLVQPPALTGFTCAAIANTPNGCSSATALIRGDTVTVTLTGTGLAGASALTIGNGGLGIGGSATIVSSTATQVTATFAVSALSLTGNRTVSVTTLGGASNALPFTLVNPANVTGVAIAPNAGLRGTAVPVTITGSGFTLTGTAVTAPFGSGITVSNVKVQSATQLTATLTISGTATRTGRAITVTNPNLSSGSATFTIN